MRKHGIVLNVTGERKAEKGQRAQAHKSCFETHKDGFEKFMPLLWWSDKVKNDFKVMEQIKYSDCYEVYGMMRTGCCGCPYNLDISKDLEKMKEYEPKLYKACIRVFGLSYALMDKFNARKKKCIPEKLKSDFSEFFEKTT